MRVYNINERYEVAERFNKIFHDFGHIKEYVNTRENLFFMRRFFNGERLLIDIDKFTQKFEVLHYTPGEYWLDMIKKVYGDEGARLFFELSYYGDPKEIDEHYNETLEILEAKKKNPKLTYKKWKYGKRSTRNIKANC